MKTRTLKSLTFAAAILAAVATTTVSANETATDTATPETSSALIPEAISSESTTSTLADTTTIENSLETATETPVENTSSETTDDDLGKISVEIVPKEEFTSLGSLAPVTFEPNPEGKPEAGVVVSSPIDKTYPYGTGYRNPWATTVAFPDKVGGTVHFIDRTTNEKIAPSMTITPVGLIPGDNLTGGRTFSSFSRIGDYYGVSKATISGTDVTFYYLKADGETISKHEPQPTYLTDKERPIGVWISGKDNVNIDSISATVTTAQPAGLADSDAEFYDIKTLDKDGNFVQLTEEATVFLPFDLTRTVERVFYYLPETGAIENIPFERFTSTGRVKFKVSHFSQYGVVYNLPDGFDISKPVTPATTQETVTQPGTNLDTETDNTNGQPVPSRINLATRPTAPRQAATSAPSTSQTSEVARPSLPKTGDTPSLLAGLGILITSLGFFGRRRKN